LLFRAIEWDWVDGDSVLVDAIDGEGSSCARGSLCTAEVAIVFAAGTQHPELNGAASITPSDLPVGLALSNGLSYDAFAFDCPVEEFEPHCEIRWRRASDRPTTDHFKKLSPVAKRELKSAIAGKMKIVVAPTPLPRERDGASFA